MDILGDDGALALQMAAEEPDPASLAAAERLRRRFSPELAAAALTQVSLRRRAREKLPLADRMFLTPAGVEQATRWVVARWRAAQFVAAGLTEVWDLGCGIGTDAMAFAAAGCAVHAVEADPTTAAFAQANLELAGGGEVITGLAEDVRVPPEAGIFLDPARRTARGRTWDTADLTPPWPLVERHLTGKQAAIAKLGPGLPKQLIPDGAGAAWVSVGGDVVEVMLSNISPPGPRAVVFPRGEAEPHILVRGAGPLPVAPPGRFIHEPDNAVIRAGLVAEAIPDGWLLAAGVAYASSEAPASSPFVTDYQVREILEYDVATLRRWIRQRRIGRLEIKRRAIDVDPAVLRRQLRPRGDQQATLLLARTLGGARAFVVERVG
ncbi:MAG: class I SAM-dependent methyltransferase [Propionibacteriaceae bacterium]|nr:class I SAM-dependent methyltransferase [Propionibacteriaceae bacterium]